MGVEEIDKDPNNTIYKKYETLTRGEIWLNGETPAGKIFTRNTSKNFQKDKYYKMPI